MNQIFKCLHLLVTCSIFCVRWTEQNAPGYVLRTTHYALLIPFALLLTACAPAEPRLASANVIEAMSGPADENFARAYEPVEFVFPRDHGPHPEYTTEWWYYTGNLADAEGGLYGFQLTFFRSALSPDQPERASDLATNQIYMAHFAITSGPDAEHHSFDRFSRGAGGLAGAIGEPEYSVWLEDWRAEQIGPQQYRLVAAAEGPDGRVALDLVLAETRDPLLHGDRGLSQKGPEPGNASYYYSLVRMDTTGTVVFDGESVEVTGLSWKDHEYGTSALSGDAVGWDWFSVTLDNGIVIMFAEIRTRSGVSQDIFEGTLAYPDGRQVVINQDDFVLTPLGEWTSPDTGIVYPSGWQVTFPAFDIELTIEPLIDDQEMDVAFTYYEGTTLIEGSANGESVRGRGYVELTGYGDSGGAYQR
ncbi:carotenoid 1,2-hydratase [bacterium]|nr:carotenoid 1,2-hydratase [bacterium]